MAKNARPSDTAAITARPMRAGTDQSVSIRKIDNGYLVRESSSNDRTGEYKSSEHFSATLPVVPTLERREEASESSLREAVEYMKGDC